MRKKDLAKKLIQENIDLFSCPICSESLFLRNNSLFCSNKHCFDLSQNGYLNLLNNSVQSKYDKKMLMARNRISQSGFFKKMINRLSEIILKEIDIQSLSSLKILDAGCGEGSHLSELLENSKKKATYEQIGVGLDISKEGIYIAAREYPGKIWCVGDLAKTPFMDKKFDIILSILSPANYMEFSRILNNQGLLIKVIPGNEYLQELRKALYHHTEKENYSNNRVIDLFEENFSILSKEQLLYQEKINSKNIKYLLQMTPLSWGTTDKNIQNVINSTIHNLTVDLTILLGSQE